MEHSRYSSTSLIQVSPRTEFLNSKINQSPVRPEPVEGLRMNCDTVIYVPLGTTRRMKMIASHRQRPMTGGRPDCRASSLHTVGPEYSKGTRSVATRSGKHA